MIDEKVADGFGAPLGRRRRARRVAGRALLTLCCACAPVGAQELSLLGGPLGGENERSYSWEATYRQSLGAHAAWSLSWLNEGHVPDHHRDGPVVQLWSRLPLLEHRLELSAGAGPYRFFDTLIPPSGASYDDTHGWGAVVSLRASYSFENRWIAQLDLNRTQVTCGPGTTAILFGIGYQLEAPGQPGASPATRSTNVTGDEIALLAGRAVLNSDESPSSSALSLEYRHGLGRHLDATASLLHEGGSLQDRRDGVAAQLWASNAFFADRITLAAGAGPYLALRRDDDGDAAADHAGESRLAGLLSVSASYRFGKRWLARATWNRVATRYDGDVDLIEAGIGVRF